MGRLPGIVAREGGNMSMSEHYEYLCRGRWWRAPRRRCRPRRARSEQARLEGAVLDASMALYRKRTDASQRQWPEYEAWRQACAELAVFIGEGEAT